MPIGQFKTMRQCKCCSLVTNQCKLCKFATDASYASWWPTLQTMQMASPDDQILNQSKLCHLVTKYATNTSGAISWPNLQLMQVVPCCCQIQYKSQSQFLGPLCLWQCFSYSVVGLIWPRGEDQITCLNSNSNDPQNIENPYGPNQNPYT